MQVSMPTLVLNKGIFVTVVLLESTQSRNVHDMFNFSSMRMLNNVF